ncbi:hypothetical protein [Bacillus pseudomycoides]|uniref:hypothetical protein n=2 Tax=Bacillus pseudomycoides TaxID=64104 RepID=UPI000BF02E60|nr:hypothetical protein [Bacillus pseudomycoides]PEI44649.1 hypothetical protein CN641_16145 [Bacillus pseudomycoides]PFY13857.1 hypothetical protein COL42_20255 [Bacillus pseudomycoides]
MMEVKKRTNPSTNSSEFVGTPRRGMAWTWHQSMMLDNEHHKETKVIDPKENSREFYEKNKSKEMYFNRHDCWENFWKEKITVNGELDIEQIKQELFEYKKFLDQIKNPQLIN